MIANSNSQAGLGNKGNSLAPIRQLRGLVNDAAKQLDQLTGDNLTAYSRTFRALANGIEVHAGNIRQDIREALAERGALPLDVQQMHAIEQLIIGAINRW